MEPREFHMELMQEVAAAAISAGELTRTAFMATVAERLVHADQLTEWVPCYHDGKGARGRRVALDGHYFGGLDLDGTATLLIAEMREGDEIHAIGLPEIRTISGRAVAFVADALDGRLSDLEPSTPAADAVRSLLAEREKLTKLRVFLLTNADAGTRGRDVEHDAIPDVDVEIQVWDLSRLHQLASAGGIEEIEILLEGYHAGGLPALPAHIGETGYQSYLCVVPGCLLADIYERHGSQLLERNVRAFLSVRAAVNKGIRQTIQREPRHFFAYNNGITATAASVEETREDGVIRLHTIRDLQIVNGGQTTASLFNARRKDKADLSGIFVQMKLSVLPPELAEEMIPNISRFANTQNKVNEADLFANHPFHRKVEELSRRIFAPLAVGSQNMTHWYYERARAQYQTEAGKLGAAGARQFQTTNPKSQVVTKTDLAKYENTWRGLPHLASLGAQKNFVHFANWVCGEYEERPQDFNDRWFQHMVAKAILFRSTELLVSKAAWYEGGYRANIVAHGLARFARLAVEAHPGLVFDLDKIWLAQGAAEPVARHIDRCCQAALKVLKDPPAGTSNLSEWAKRKEFWDRLCAVDILVDPDLARWMRALDEEKGDQRSARRNERIDQAMKAVKEVFRLSQDGYWSRALGDARHKGLLDEKGRALLALAAGRKNFVPSDAQAVKLVEMALRLEEEGIL